MQPLPPQPLLTHAPLSPRLKNTTSTALVVSYLSSSPLHVGPTSTSWRSWMRTLAGDLPIIWSFFFFFLKGFEKKNCPNGYWCKKAVKIATAIFMIDGIKCTFISAHKHHLFWIGRGSCGTGCVVSRILWPVLTFNSINNTCINPRKCRKGF